MDELHVDDRGFLRVGREKLCRVTESGELEFLRKDRRSGERTVVVSPDELRAAAKLHSLQTDSKSDRVTPDK